MTLMDSPMITEMCITAWSFVRTTIETHHTEFHRCYWSSLSPTKVSHFCVLMRKKMEVDEWSKRRTKNGKEWCGKKEEEVKTPASLDGKKRPTFSPGFCNSQTNRASTYPFEERLKVKASCHFSQVYKGSFLFVSACMNSRLLVFKCPCNFFSMTISLCKDHVDFSYF